MTWVKRIAVLCTVAVVAIVVAAPPAAAVPTEGVYWIRNAVSPNYCLLMSGSRGSLYNCYDFPDQEWALINPDEASPSVFFLVDTQNSRCLIPPTRANNVVVSEEPCDWNLSISHIRQQWILEDFTFPGIGAATRISNPWANKCLLGQNGSWKVAVTMYTCGPYADQAWYPTYLRQQ